MALDLLVARASTIVLTAAQGGGKTSQTVQPGSVRLIYVFLCLQQQSGLAAARLHVSAPQRQDLYWQSWFTACLKA